MCANLPICQSAFTGVSGVAKPVFLGAQAHRQNSESLHSLISQRARRTRTWPLRPPPSTPPPRFLLRRQSPRLHPHRIKRSLLLLMPLSQMRLRPQWPRPRQPRLLRPCPRQRRGSGSSRNRGSTPPNTTRSVPSSPTCVSASSRFTLNIFYFFV